MRPRPKVLMLDGSAFCKPWSRSRRTPSLRLANTPTRATPSPQFSGPRFSQEMSIAGCLSFLVTLPYVALEPVTGPRDCRSWIMVGSAFCIGRTRRTGKRGSELNPKKISGHQVLRSCRPSRLLCRLSADSCDMPAEKLDDRLKVLVSTDRR